MAGAAEFGVTHLVIEPEHRRQYGRIVPVELIDTATGDIRLRCTIAESDKLGAGPGIDEGIRLSRTKQQVGTCHLRAEPPVRVGSI